MKKNTFMTTLSLEEITERFHLCLIKNNLSNNTNIYKGSHINGKITDKCFSFSIREGVLQGTNRYLLKGFLQQTDNGFDVTWRIK